MNSDIPDDISGVETAGHLVLQAWENSGSRPEVWKAFEAEAEEWKCGLVAIRDALERNPHVGVAPYWDMTLAQQFAREARLRKGRGDPTWRLWAAWSHEYAIGNNEPTPEIDWRDEL